MKRARKCPFFLENIDIPLRLEFGGCALHIFHETFGNLIAPPVIFYLSTGIIHLLQGLPLLLCPFLGRSLPVLQQPKWFNLYLTLAFLTVLMTYFGVNYFLGGMHSYA